jgi:hypothetical protein
MAQKTYFLFRKKAVWPRRYIFCSEKRPYGPEDIFSVQKKGCMAQKIYFLFRKKAVWPKEFSCLAVKRQVPISIEGCEWCGRPGRQIPRGGKLNLLNLKKCDFFRD